MVWFSSEYFLTAIAEWIACIIYASNPPKRLKRPIAMAVSFAMLFVQVLTVWLVTSHRGYNLNERLGIQLLKACLYIVVMTCHIFIICSINIKTALILGLYSFMSAELAWGISMFLHFLVIRGTGKLSALSRYGIIAIVFIVIYGLVFLAERSYYKKAVQHMMTTRDLIVTLVICLLCYALSNLQMVFLEHSWGELWDKTFGNVPRWFFGLVGLLILYGRRIWNGYLHTRHELEMINDVFAKQKSQYEQALVNAEAINQQYHDLKNQIAIMRSDLSTAEQEQWLDGLEKKVAQLEPKRLTGNPVLDTILWEKNQYCTLHEIRLSYVINGELFSDIANDDLCVIFGGALDNAIEAVSKLEDTERRIIHVKTMEQQGYIVICVENINDAPLKYQNGILITSKEDTDHHGYGIKGIRYTAEKYDGSITITQEELWFRLMVFLKENAG